MSILIDDQRFINLQFHYLEKKGVHVNTYTFLKTKEDFEKNKEDPNLQVLNTGWKVLNWAEYNDLYGQCIDYKTKTDGTVTTDLNYIKFRDLKLKKCLKRWDVKDGNNQEIPVSESTINHLEPSVAAEMLSGFERVTELEETDLKN